MYFNTNIGAKNTYFKSILAINKINKQKNFTCHCWNFVIKRSFLINNNIFFNNIRIFEDQVFVSEILLKAKIFFFGKEQILIHNEYSSSLSRMTNYTSALSCTKVIEKIFLNKRINFMINKLKIYFLILDARKIKKLLLVINKISKTYKLYKSLKFFKVKKIALLRELIKKNKNYIEIQLTRFKKNDQNKLKKYIFSCGIFGRSLALICKSNDIKINGFLDNNKKMLGENFLGYKIFNPNILSRLSKKNLSKYVVLIGHNDNKIKKDISNQILKYNIKKNNIVKIKFFRELYNV